MDAVSHGVEPDRVAQLRIKNNGGERRGSGYRVTTSLVLTAAHLVVDADDVEVVFRPDRPDEWSARATVRLCTTKGDVAVLTIEPPAGQPVSAPVRFGRVGWREATLQCRAVGFPRFKSRRYHHDTAEIPANAQVRYRDSYQADGMIATLSNAREGTLEITVAVAPARELDPAHSPWEGMSGAAVWCHGRVVGVVSRHHLSDGLNRLAAVRAERWYDELGDNDLAELRNALGLPDLPEQLSDVISEWPVADRPRRHSGVLDERYETQVESWFVEPEGFDDARRALATDRIVFLRGEARRGRRTAAIQLLHEHRRYDDLIVQLPTQPDRPDRPTLDSRDIAPEDRLLLDLTSVDDDRLAMLQDELLTFVPAVQEQRAVLVVVLRAGVAVRAALGRPVDLGRPDGGEVLRAHLTALGVKTSGAELSPVLGDVLGRGSMTDLADLAVLIDEAGRRSPSAHSETWLKEALAARDDRSQDVAARVAQHSESGLRAFLLAAAMFEGRPADDVFTAQQLLLQALGVKPRHEFEQPDRVHRLHQAGVEESGDTRIWFTKLNDARIVRRHFWDNFPGLRDPFRDWVVECGHRLPLSDDGGDEAVRRFVHECLRLRRVGDVIHAVQRWTSAEPPRTALAARALEIGLTDVDAGALLRHQCYLWAWRDQVAPLARVVIAASVDVIILNYPDQALVRLRHLASHRDVGVARAARAELLRLTGDRRNLRRFLSLLTDQRYRRLRKPSDRRLFLITTAPKRLVEERPLITDKVVRQQLVDGWRAVLDRDGKNAYEAVVWQWLDVHATSGHRGLIDVLVAACATRFASRATLFAIGRRWCKESARGSDDASRRATFARLESGIDATRDGRSNQEGRG